MSAPKAERPGQSVPRIRSAYDGSRVVVRLICTEDEDRTQQQFKDECDINVLMKRYERTGILPLGPDIPPQYADVSAMDFTTSMNQVAMVRGVFSQLDAHTRARFENNPELMLEFIADPANEAEAVKLGLLSSDVLQSGTEVERAGSEGVSKVATSGASVVEGNGAGAPVEGAGKAPGVAVPGG